MTTTILTGSDIARIAGDVGFDVLMDDMIERLERACREYDPGETIVRARDGFHYTRPQPGLLEWMPVCRVGHLVTVKTVGYHPANPGLRNLPTILSTLAAYETATGHIRAIADGTFLTALRTAAASAIASRVLARPESRVIGVVGCGAQAVAQLHALTRCFAVDEVLACDARRESVDSFAARISRWAPASVNVREVPIDRLVASADILVTATSLGVGQGPLFPDQETRPWLHVNAVGSDFVGKYELPVAMLRRALVCPDHPEQALREGEAQQLEPGDLGPSLPELIQRRDELTAARERLSVFDSTGWALEDHVALEMILEHATRCGVGAAVQLEWVGPDPMDPYRFESC